MIEIDLKGWRVGCFLVFVVTLGNRRDNFNNDNDSKNSDKNIIGWKKAVIPDR